MPGNSFRVAFAARPNGSKMRSCAPGVSPMPPSLTVNTVPSTPSRRLTPISLLLTLIALIAVGIVKGKLAGMNLFRSVAEIVVIGALSAGGGYVLGMTIPRLFGY